MYLLVGLAYSTLHSKLPGSSQNAKLQESRLRAIAYARGRLLTYPLTIAYNSVTTTALTSISRSTIA